jgi:aminoglycoside/choline kinase family phosphotransferase
MLSPPREQALRDFALVHTAWPADAPWLPLAGDAGGRRYYRLRHGGHSRICVDAPPAVSNTAAFTAVRERLEQAGLRVPALHALDPVQGFMVLDDLGESLLFDVLDLAAPSSDYAGALPLLHRVQAVDPTGLPAYSADLLEEELSRFPDWFCEAFLEVALPPQLLSDLNDLLIDCALSQPQVFVHRDYHCRNLLPQPDGPPGLIDFQDAVSGPVCYDLVSLLKDCYLRWPPAQVRRWALAFREQRRAAGLPAADTEAEFLRWFDWIGLQRHLKVLGNFTRLALRDGRDRYLGDIPQVLVYIEEVLEAYADFADFARWWRAELRPQLAGRDWGSPS